jgi:glycosyltransferase involved in cell wall biosynthesis
MMRYSVVIPTFDNKVLLRNTLAVLNHQRGVAPGSYEVVVVDDGSRDGTDRYIEGVNETYELRYLYLERCADSSRARTRNHGWKNATGDVVAFIDSDILVNEDYISQLERCFSRSRDICVIGNRLMLDRAVAAADIESGKVFTEHRFDPARMSILEFRYFLYEIGSYNANAIMCPWMQIYSCNMAVAREWLSRVGGFDEHFKFWGMEDLEIGFALYDAGVQIVINPKLEVLHQFHGTRNDLIVEQKKIPGYEVNIDYFLEKHPHALKMSKKIAYKFLKGEISPDKMLIDDNRKPITIDLKERSKLPEIEDLLLTLTARDGLKIVVNDFVEDTDLDIWTNMLGVTRSVAKYHPASRRLDPKAMIRFLREEKNRQQMESRTSEGAGRS